MRAIWAVSILASCFPSVPSLEIPANGARSALIVEGGKITAIDLAEDAGTFVLPRDDVSVVVLEYRCTLDRFGLEPGEVVVRADGIGSLIPRPPLAILHASSEDGVKVLDALPEALASARIESKLAPCVDFDPQVIEVSEDLDEAVDLAVAISPATVLIGTNRARFFLVSASGLVPRPDLSADVPQRGGYLAPDGRIWLTGDLGRVYSGPLDDLEMRATRTTTGSYSWMVLAGPPDATTPFELFYAGRNEVVEYFDGASWSLLDMRAGTVEGRTQLAWIAPGRVVAVGFDTDAYFVFGPEYREEKRLSSGGRPLSVAYTPSLGVVIATLDGALFIDGVPIDVAAANPFGARLDVVAPLDDGLIFGGKEGYLGQWFPGHGVCEAKSIGKTIYRLVALEDGFLAITVPLFGQTRPSVTLLTRTTPRVPECLR